MIPFLDLLAVEPHAVAEGDGGVVGEILRTFKVDWPFFISQCVSFLIVAVLLKKFAFGPIQNMLEQRKSRIAEGEEKLKRIEQQLAESEATTAAAIAKANEEATRLIQEARDSAAALSESKAQEAVAQAQSILAKAEAAAKAEREQIAAELKKEFGRLVTATTAQVTGKVLSDDDMRRINDEALAKVEA
ncbi:F-type H+-transporting ATPase subunit b [Haloferula luteola]|uniref:ATP synthase subunit b n=1 Tax=Haloferula luteola TaxID=595692 RepID=A0A840V4G2_9BACT|nr:F0F1 ATP synthase subunit B [Haloferula luteola]MBB5352905.1 F-type H+-transporting ATPase subunit b [Haloferula luteola]